MRAPPFQTILRRFVSSKVPAFWRREISSNLGCCHVPGEGVSIGVGCKDWAVGVVGFGRFVKDDEVMLLVGVAGRDASMITSLVWEID